MFGHGVRSQLMLQETMHHGSSHGLIESASKRLLKNDDEVKAVIRHVNNVSYNSKVRKYSVFDDRL